MSKTGFTDTKFLKPLHQGVQYSCALCTQLEVAAAGTTFGLTERHTKINRESHSKTEVRFKTKQDSTDRKTHSDISVSA